MAREVSLVEIEKLFAPEVLDEAVCRAMLLKLSRGVLLSCPACSAVFDDHRTRRLLDGKDVDCHECGVSSSPRTGTIFEGSSLTSAQIVYLLTMLYWDIPVDHIAARANCSRSTVYNWRNRMTGVATA